MPATEWKILSDVVITLATVAFAVTGVLAVRADKDIDLIGALVLGLIAAIGGGLIRDVLAGQTTRLMRPELYATPVLLGCIAYVLVLSYLPDYRGSGAVACILGTFVIRAAAIHWNLSPPAFARLTMSKKSE